MKFKHIYQLLLATTVLFTSCEKEEIDRIEPSHRSVYNSETDFGNQVEINGTITFGDTSAGVSSREWTFPKNAFTLLESDNNTTSSKPIIRAVARKVGFHKVQLSQVYKKNAYLGTSLKGKNLDTIILVEVLDSIKHGITANFLKPDGTLGDPLVLENDAFNSVQAGSIIRYDYSTTTGSPEGIDFGVDGATIELEDKENKFTDVKYKSLADYDFLFEASRKRPSGYDALNLKNFIKVIKSSDPVTLDKQTTVDGIIRLDFSRDMDPSSIKKEQFSVRVTNGDRTLTPIISNVSIDEDSKNIILIEVDGETIYDNDIVYIDYTAGSLATSDGVFSESITDVVAKVDLSGKSNILEDGSFDYGFESGDSDKWVYLWWGGIWGDFTSTITGDQAHSGSKSLKISMKENGGAIIGHQESGEFITFSVKAGKSYQIGVWSYVENTGSTPAGSDVPDLRFYTTTQTDWAILPAHTFGSDYKTGEWVFGTSTQTFSEDGETSFQIRGANEFNPDILDIYIDDISVKEVKLRP